MGAEDVVERVLHHQADARKGGNIGGVAQKIFDVDAFTGNREEADQHENAIHDLARCDAVADHFVELKEEQDQEGGEMRGVDPSELELFEHLEDQIGGNEQQDGKSRASVKSHVVLQNRG